MWTRHCSQPWRRVPLGSGSGSATRLVFAPHITHVIWDWNGTLLDDRDLVLDITNDMLRECVLPALALDRYLAIFDFPIERYYAELGFTDAHGGFAALAGRFITEYDRRVSACALQAGAAETVAACARRGLTQSVLTAAQRTSVEALLTHHGVRQHVGAVIGHDDHYARAKEALGVAWLQEAGLDPARTVLIGDTVHDFAVAQAMGVGCVLVANGHNAPARLAACGCPVVPALRAPA